MKHSRSTGSSILLMKPNGTEIIIKDFLSFFRKVIFANYLEVSQRNNNNDRNYPPMLDLNLMSQIVRPTRSMSSFFHAVIALALALSSGAKLANLVPSFTKGPLVIS